MSSAPSKASPASVANALMAKVNGLESAIKAIFEMTLNVKASDSATVVRSVHQIARRQLAGAPSVRTRCQPNCQKYHTRTEAAEILGVDPRSVYRLESRGLKVSRRSGDPRYLHHWLDEFMATEGDCIQA